VIAMSGGDHGHKAAAGDAYIARVLDDTQRHSHDLLAENERLQALVRSLESEIARLGEKSLLEGIERENRALQGLIKSMRWEQIRLEQQLRKLRDEDSSRACEQARLHTELAAIEHRSRGLIERIERQNANLANLYTATYQLHGTLDSAHVLSGIHEILANLVGSEQAIVFEARGPARELVVTSANGVDPAPYGALRLGEGPLGRAATGGDVLLLGPGGDAEPFAEEPDVTACVPLKLEQELVGFIAVFRLLPHKAAFEELDRELLGLLATHAATALYSARLREAFMALTSQSR
jgi:hypothetical protein